MDPVVRRALVEAIAECVVTAAPVQISFIANYIHNLGSERPRSHRQPPVHEDRNNSSNSPLDELCLALESTGSNQESYTQSVIRAMEQLLPGLKRLDTSDTNIVHYTVACGSSRIDIPVNASSTPVPVLGLVDTIAYHLNQLSV